MAPLTGVVERHGGWYHHDLLPGGKLQGFDKFYAAVASDKPVQKALAEQVMATISTIGSQVAPMSDPDAEVSTDMTQLYDKTVFPDDHA